MKINPFLIFFLVLGGCNSFNNAVEKARQFIGKAQPVTAAPDPLAKTIIPPSLEDDKVVQFSPKDKLVALVGQFNRTPDGSLLGITIEEFTKQKNILSIKRDTELVTVLNGVIPHIQSRRKNAIQLLVQMHPLLLGENQKFLRSVLARGFDYAPDLTITQLIKFEQDKLCSMVTELPEEIRRDDYQAYLESRFAAVKAVKMLEGQGPLFAPFVENCSLLLQSEINKLITPAETPPVPISPPAENP